MRAWSVDAEQYLQKQLNAYKVGDLRELPKHIRVPIMKQCERIAMDHVFGAGNDHQVGIGTPDNMNPQCVEAYIKEQTVHRDTPEPNYEQNLAKMRADLERCQARRRAERQAEDDELEALP